MSEATINIDGEIYNVPYKVAEEIIRLGIENKRLGIMEAIYRRLLECMADTATDNIDDIECDIRDWLEAIDALKEGRMIGIFECDPDCEKCDDKYWPCQIIKLGRELKGWS